jgi:hypothetical protein
VTKIEHARAYRAECVAKGICYACGPKLAVPIFRARKCRAHYSDGLIAQRKSPSRIGKSSTLTFDDFERTENAQGRR